MMTTFMPTLAQHLRVCERRCAGSHKMTRINQSPCQKQSRMMMIMMMMREAITTSDVTRCQCAHMAMPPPMSPAPTMPTLLILAALTPAAGRS